MRKNISKKFKRDLYW